MAHYYACPQMLTIAGITCSVGYKCICQLLICLLSQTLWAILQVRLLLLAALSQEHILYIGPPGTAKSELGRRLSRLCAGTFFERLLTRFSVPEVSVCCTL